MKRISLVAAALMLFAGARLHAQATKQDTTRRPPKTGDSQAAASKRPRAQAGRGRRPPGQAAEPSRRRRPSQDRCAKTDSTKKKTSTSKKTRQEGHDKPEAVKKDTTV